jgi:hypothetical protein
MIPFAIGTRPRKSEQLSLRVRQGDFFRNLIVFAKTKVVDRGLIEMNSEAREILMPLCKGKRADDYAWLNPKTGSHSMTSRKRLSTLARIRVLTA